MSIVNSCPICGSIKKSPVVSFDHRVVVSCVDCMHYYASEYSADRLVELYEDNYYKSVDDQRIILWNESNFDEWDALIGDIPTITEILDIGAGTGGFLMRVAITYPDAKIFAIESSKHAREYLVKTLKNINVIDGSAEDLNKIPDSSYETVTLLQTLEHVAKPQKVLDNIYRILKPGGFFILTVPNRKSYLVKRYGYNDPLCYSNQTHLHFYSKEVLTKALKNTGFESVVRLKNWGNKKSFLMRVIQYTFRQIGISTELRYLCRK